MLYGISVGAPPTGPIKGFSQAQRNNDRSARFTEGFEVRGSMQLQCFRTTTSFYAIWNIYLMNLLFYLLGIRLGGMWWKQRVKLGLREFVLSS